MHCLVYLALTLGVSLRRMGVIVTIIVITNSTTRTHVMLNSNCQIGSPTLLDRSYPRSEHPLQIRLNGRGLYLAAWLITNPRLQVEIS